MCPSIPNNSDVAATADCLTNDGRTYTTGDGSKWMLACDEDCTGYDLPDALEALDLSQCIDLCVDRGIECIGVAFAFDYQLCRLRSKMVSIGNSRADL
jgi:hypothetical protein